ncbi:saccharopine dehydrogenase family protein [Halostreptopolyspora alba]|uniref:Saccharopine dehydrogenase n=1 Tax=Halostreptopolyspora alba TaxID=2487137 RepID=A0A3N0EI08_9ACTN|nr:saccharopine dehydrogenase [Nocardiopsaceae bacterium YIM 96095]
MTETITDRGARRDTRPASGTVHWVGTGRSTGRGLRAVCDQAETVVVWGRAADRARACLRRVGIQDQVEFRLLDLEALAAEIRPGDIVVSMVPATEHAELLRRCLESGGHFVCSSYTSPAMEEVEPEARANGSVILTEAGLDPGIDHLFAHDLVERASGAVGSRPGRVEFTSFCGGVPAQPNSFRYRFSWAPAGVLTALRTPARYIEHGRERTAVHPWKATQHHRVAEESFEAYPNRDSVPFIAAYGIPHTWRVDRFVRGTLRLDGWHDAWSEVFPVVERGDDAAIGALADDLARQYPMRAEDRDRVVLQVRLDLRTDDGHSWSDSHVLDVVGDDQETAMARCVSETLACGIRAILHSRLPAGISRAASGAEGRRWLTELHHARIVPKLGGVRSGGTHSSE